ncbi:ExeA family protein [Desulfofustis glycolicus]|uniref:Type II secretory pathway, component ExeA (Predicted ATPase) n=1 Tax=Desulfofustis glycolicus DSM 9705 TaxID=1121409 RepID=A0A1M5XZ76_9BACT|nr:AAA family ATPase [Desulfofustis glycolicus]MCB2218266.1 AAA family ATPase [Desulfobulbaceae bacterium]SHI05100.1 Type II secretory pathway, component ExeA (predicted ATPase) [Desulfofustis glycolicus DSM 9705]
MYKHYFGLNENPFSIAPDPRYLYMSERHQEALAHLCFGAVSDGCIILLTGEVGTGKTTICRRFLDELDENTDVAIIINPKLTADELLGAICDEFEIDRTDAIRTTRQRINLLNDYLLQAHARNRQALLVIDEAQHLDRDVLEMLRLLTNLETDRHKLLKIILLGQSELALMLARPDLSQINQRITSRYHLGGLQRSDLSGYIRHRVTVAGGGRSPLFGKRACRAIYELTGGIPRLINNLCDRSLLGAYSEGKEQVDQRTVKRAARELFGDRQPPRQRPARRLLVPLAGLLAAALAVGMWLGSFTSDHSPPDTAKSTGVEDDTADAPPGNEASASADDAADPLLYSAGKKGENQINIGPITVRDTSSNRRDTGAHVVHP